MEVKCSKGRKCYGGFAGERAWLCDKVTRVVVEHMPYSVVDGKHNGDLDMALDSFSSKLIYCKYLGKIRIA